MKKPERTINVATFEHAALLRCHGFEFKSAAFTGRRVSLMFLDPDGSGAEIIRTHETEGHSVNSLRFCEGLNWAKGIVFSTRDQIAV